MLNSRQSLFTVTLIRSGSKSPHDKEYPFSRSYGAILPSSLERILSSALEFSSYPPVSVYGTATLLTRYEVFLGSMGSARSSIARLPLTSRGNVPTDFPMRTPYWLGPRIPTRGGAYPPASPLRSNASRWYRNVDLLSIVYFFRPRLRCRLTPGGLTFPGKP